MTRLNTVGPYALTDYQTISVAAPVHVFRATIMRDARPIIAVQNGGDGHENIYLPLNIDDEQGQRDLADFEVYAASWVAANAGTLVDQSLVGFHDEDTFVAHLAGIDVR